MTGGSQAEARAIDPPRFGGFGLAAIQSGYGEEPWAKEGRRLAPTRAAAPTPPHPTRWRKLRRFSRRPLLDPLGDALRSAMDIGLSFLVGRPCRRVHEGKRMVHETVPHAERAVKRGGSTGEGQAGVGGRDLDLGQLQLAAHDVGAEVDGHALVKGDAAGQALPAESTVRGEDQALR